MVSGAQVAHAFARRIAAELAHQHVRGGHAHFVARRHLRGDLVVSRSPGAPAQKMTACAFEDGPATWASVTQNSSVSVPRTHLELALRAKDARVH